MLGNWIDSFGQTPWLKYVLEIASLLAAAVLIRYVLMRWLRRLARRSTTLLDDRVLAMLNRALIPALALGLITASLNLFPVPATFLKVANRTLYLGVLVVALYYAAKIFQVLLNAWLFRNSSTRAWQDAVRFMTRLLFAGLGVMLVLDNLGISLTAVWTTLGIGSIAVALALQDTLTNFFAGVYLRLDSPVHIGDFMKLDTGDQGFVTQLGWRSTRIQSLSRNVIVVPNAKLASAVITNMSLPEPHVEIAISVSVGYRSDPDEVERILVDEAARAAAEMEEILAEPAPFVRFIPGFGPSSLKVSLMCRVRTAAEQEIVQHELRKRIWKRLRREGIEMPFPGRDVHVYTHNGRAEPEPQPEPASRASSASRR